MTDTRKITYLPTAPVRYNGSTPSMSRRGGIRLHPVSDGTANMVSSTQYLRTRDMLGGKLRDHVDPVTGLFTHTSSLIESEANYGVGMDEPTRPAISGAPTGALKYLPASVRVDSSGDRVYIDQDGRRIRTTDIGEGTIGAVPRKPAPVRTPGNGKRGRGVDGGPRKPRAPRVPGATGANGRITDDDVRSYVIALGKSRGVIIDLVTPNMMRDGREALKLLRIQAAQVLAKADKKAGK